MTVPGAAEKNVQRSSPSPFDGPTSSVVRRWGSRGTVIVGALVAIVLLAVGATLGVALAPQASTPSSEAAAGSVEIGFARDMVLHHTQGVSMANLEEQNGADPEVKIVAFDIASTQQTDIGEMNGWLDLWGRPRLTADAAMAWMGGSAQMGGMAMGEPSGAAESLRAAAVADGAAMPGMATNTEMAKLRTLRGKDSDVYFMQLMVRHHQGGGPMMTYAAQHASVPAVRTFAQKMFTAQTQEISIMTQMLAARGAQPLPFTG